MLRLAYVDTSALAALLFREPGADELRERLVEFRRFSSNLLAAELHAAGAREEIPASLTAQCLAAIEWVFPNRNLEPELGMVLSAGLLRGADLWHVGCALYLSELLVPVTFFTRDRRQGEIAAAVGLTVM